MQLLPTWLLLVATNLIFIASLIQAFTFFAKDVARVESKTVISTPNKLDTVPQPSDGVQGQLGYWMSPDDLNKKIQELYPGCMKGP